MNVLVLCTGNSARSIFLESIFNHSSDGRITAFSAGSTPTGIVNPAAIALLNRLGHNTSNARSKSWDEFATPGAPHMDVVITVCGNAENETCPVWPGTPIRGFWGVDDPAEVTTPPEAVTAAFIHAYTLLEARAKSLFELDIEKMTPAELGATLRVQRRNPQNHCVIFTD